MKVICFDLDDTLCKEIDYLKSAYKEIAQFATAPCKGCSVSVDILTQKAYASMLEAYYSGKNAFEQLNAFLGIQNPISDYINIYRNHLPNIFLSEETKKTISYLKDKGYVLGLITDGRSIQQRNKINALKLSQWFESENIVISEEFGSEKPSERNYRYFMNKIHDADFFYVGDNLKKDFVSANALGWTTICLLDDGENIHKQDFEQHTIEYLPKHTIKSIAELINLI